MAATLTTAQGTFVTPIRRIKKAISIRAWSCRARVRRDHRPDKINKIKKEKISWNFFVKDIFWIEKLAPSGSSAMIFVILRRSINPRHDSATSDAFEVAGLDFRSPFVCFLASRLRLRHSPSVESRLAPPTVASMKG
jgi:hypothetical protein